MKRTQIYLDDEQDQLLEARAQAAGTTKSAVIRDAIDAYFDRPGRRSERMDRLMAAARDAFGIAPYLPDGAEYVERIRSLDVERQAELDQRRRS